MAVTVRPQPSLRSRGLAASVRHMSPDLLAIGEVTERAGVSVSALRFYEGEQGIVRSVRSAGGQRRYTRSELRRVAFIKGRAARRPVARRDPRRARHAARRTHAHPSRLEAAVERLAGSARRADRGSSRRLHDDLSSCIGCGCLSFGDLRAVQPRRHRRGERQRPALPLRRRAAGRGPRRMTDLATTRVDRWLWAVRLCRTHGDATDACPRRPRPHQRRRGEGREPGPGGSRTRRRTQVGAAERVVEVVRVIEKRVGRRHRRGVPVVDHSPPRRPRRQRRSSTVTAVRAAPTQRDRRDLDRLRRRRASAGSRPSGRMGTLRG